MLGAAFVLLIVSVLAGVFIFVVYPMLTHPESPDWPAWADVPHVVCLACCYAAPVLAFVGAAFWQAHAVRERISGAVNWFMAIAVAGVSFHIGYWTSFFIFPD